jgi:hypothetical protein
VSFFRLGELGENYFFSWVIGLRENFCHSGFAPAGNCLGVPLHVGEQGLVGGLQERAKFRDVLFCFGVFWVGEFQASLSGMCHPVRDELAQCHPRFAHVAPDMPYSRKQYCVGAGIDFQGQAIGEGNTEFPGRILASVIAAFRHEHISFFPVHEAPDFAQQGVSGSVIVMLSADYRGLVQGVAIVQGRTDSVVAIRRKLPDYIANGGRFDGGRR